MDTNKYIDDVIKKAKALTSEAATPDPFWPVDAIPTHLSPEQRAAAIEVGSFVSLKEAEWKCQRCGSENNPSRDNPGFCVRCATEIKATTTTMAKKNGSWMEDAKALGLEIFERQPEETDTEWRIWEAYRNSYPMKLPTWTELAERVGCAVGTVVNASQKWGFKLRILEWSRHCDASSQQERIESVAELNKAQYDLAKGMLEKVSAAILAIEPQYLKPNEIVNMAKLATELQRRAVESKPEKIEQPGIVDKVSASHDVTAPNDLAEIAEILNKAGALDGRTFGVEKTTRIVVKGGDGDE